MSRTKKILGSRDWDEDFRGWRCDEVKTHLLTEVRVDGAAGKLEDFQARADIGLVAWRGSAVPPDSIMVVLVSTGDTEKRSGLSPLLTALIGGVFGILAGSAAPWWTKYWSSSTIQNDSTAPQSSANQISTASADAPTDAAPTALPTCPTGAPSGASCDHQGHIVRFAKTLYIPQFRSGTTRQILNLNGFRAGTTLSARISLSIAQPPQALQQVSIKFLRERRNLGEKAFSKQECTETQCNFSEEVTARTVSGAVTADLTLAKCLGQAGPTDCEVRGTLVVVDTQAPQP